MIRCDSAVAEPDAIRCDVATLKSTLQRPKRLDDGSWRYEAVLARADVQMAYPWGTEVATKEALSDEAYLAQLVGLSVVAGHPDKRHRERVEVDKPGTYIEVGTVLGSRWDEAQAAVVVDLVVKNPEANAAIKSGKDGVSEGYTVSRLDTSTSPARQLGRRPNHVALSLDLSPRMAGARIRADNKGPRMDPELLLALFAAYGLRTDTAEHAREDLDALKAHKATAEAERTRADAAEARLSLVSPLLSELGVDSTRTDALDTSSLIAGKVSEVVELHRRADALGVQIEGATGSASELRKAIAVALGADATRCDVQSYCDGWIDSAKPATSLAKVKVTPVVPASASTPTLC